MRLISSFTESRILNELKRKIADLVLLSDKQHEDLKGYSNVANNMHKTILGLREEVKNLKEEKELIQKEKSNLAVLLDKQKQDLDAYPQITKALYTEIDMQKSENEKLKQQIEILKMEKEKLKEDFKISETVRKGVMKDMKELYEKQEVKSEISCER